jgi:hypothetical protein
MWTDVARTLPMGSEHGTRSLPEHGRLPGNLYSFPWSPELPSKLFVSRLVLNSALDSNIIVRTLLVSLPMPF